MMKVRPRTLGAWLAVIVIGGVAIAALEDGQKDVYDDSNLRDPMMPFKRPVVETKGPKPPPMTNDVDNSDPKKIAKIKGLIAGCRIDGLVLCVGKSERYVCIDDKILVKGDKAVDDTGTPGEELRIAEITDKVVLFSLDGVTWPLTVTPVVSNELMSASSPTKEEEKKKP